MGDRTILSPLRFEAYILRMSMREKLELLQQKRSESEQGGGTDRIATQHQKGKMTARERLDVLLDPGSFVEKRDALLRHCEAVGRDPAEIEISAQAFVRDRYDATLEVAAYYLREGAHHVILVMRADQGPEGLKRLAHEVAEPLREQFG